VKKKPSTLENPVNGACKGNFHNRTSQEGANKRGMKGGNSGRGGKKVTGWGRFAKPGERRETRSKGGTSKDKGESSVSEKVGNLVKRRKCRRARERSFIRGEKKRSLDGRDHCADQLKANLEPRVEELQISTSKKGDMVVTGKKRKSKFE